MNISAEIKRRIALQSERDAELWGAQAPHIDGRISVKRQLAVINQFLRYRIGCLEESSIQVRMCLVDAISVDAWLAQFESEVIPFMLMHRVLDRIP